MAKVQQARSACIFLFAPYCAVALPCAVSAQNPEVETAPRVAVENIAPDTGPTNLMGAASEKEQVSRDPGVTITVGAEGVQAHAPAYAVRSEVAGSALLVTFSSLPPSSRRLESGRSGLQPTGSPLSGVVTSGFGLRTHPLSGRRVSHLGVDVAAREGTPVSTTTDGIVSVAGWRGGYGLLVSIDHGDGWQTRYGHLSELNVKPGQQVTSGDVIGFVGSTGNSTGPHLHYEVRQNGQAIDPALHRPDR